MSEGSLVDPSGGAAADLSGVGQQVPGGAPGGNVPTMKRERLDEDDDDDDDRKPGRERRKIEIKFIQDKSRRHITFSKRKAGIMKKAYELSVLTGTQVLLLVVSETGLVYTFTTPKLQPLVTKPEGKNLIQSCLNAPEEPQAAPGGAHDAAAAAAAGTGVGQQGMPGDPMGMQHPPVDEGHPGAPHMPDQSQRMPGQPGMPAGNMYMAPEQYSQYISLPHQQQQQRPYGMGAPTHPHLQSHSQSHQ